MKKCVALLICALFVVSFSHSETVKESLIDYVQDIVVNPECEIRECFSITIEYKVVVREYRILQMQ